MDATFAREFDLDVSGAISEEEILCALWARLDAMLCTDPMRLLQILYRMDVDERAAEEALDDANPAGNLARLILQRTRLKAVTRAAFRAPPVRDEDADLAL